MRIIEASREQIIKFNLLMGEIKKLIPEIDEVIKLVYVKDEVKKELEEIKADFEYKLRRKPSYANEYFNKIETKIDKANTLLKPTKNYIERCYYYFCVGCFLL